MTGASVIFDVFHTIFTSAFGSPEKISPHSITSETGFLYIPSISRDHIEQL